MHRYALDILHHMLYTAPIHTAPIYAPYPYPYAPINILPHIPIYTPIYTPYILPPYK